VRHGKFVGILNEPDGAALKPFRVVSTDLIGNFATQSYKPVFNAYEVTRCKIMLTINFLNSNLDSFTPKMKLGAVSLLEHGKRFHQETSTMGNRS
jgi:hypothetical protein